MKGKFTISWEHLFAISFLLTGVLISFSFILPPKGVIDPSVLQAAGELLAFPTIFAACKCIMAGLGGKVTIGKASIEVNKKDETNS